MTNIQFDTLQFLREVKENNNRLWFEPNKPRYLAAQANIKAWLVDLLAQLKLKDNSILTDAPRGVGRIYRDVRFSKNKEPYRAFLGAMVFRGPADTLCEFYIHFEPGNIFAGGGLYMPTSQQLKLVREDIAYSTAELKKITSKLSFINCFGKVEGERLQRPPKGFAVDHPDLEWLKLKQYLIMRNFSDATALSDDFMEEVVKTFVEARPLFDLIDRALMFKE